MEEEYSGNDSQFQKNIVNDGFCHVCFVEDSLEQNPIVFCDNCNVAVHKDCYYIDIIPEGSWYCDLCKYIMENPNTEKPRCCICNKLPEQDAFKRTQDGRWCHVICAITLVGSFFISNVECPVIEPADQIANERFELQCDICDDPPKGACLQCYNERCTKSFHPICAFKSNRYEKIPDELSDGAICWRIYCPAHRTDRDLVINDNNEQTLCIPPPQPQLQQTTTTTTLQNISTPTEYSVFNNNSTNDLSTTTTAVENSEVSVTSITPTTTLSPEDIDLLLKRSHGRPSKYGQPPNISMNDRSVMSQLIRGSYRLFYKEQNLIYPPPNDIVDRSTYEFTIQNKWLEIPDSTKKEYEVKFIESLKEKKNNIGTRTRQNAGIRRNISDYYMYNNNGYGNNNNNNNNNERRRREGNISSNSNRNNSNSTTNNNISTPSSSSSNNNNNNENIPNVTISCERFQNEYVNPYFDTSHLDKLKHLVTPENDPLFIIPPLSSCFAVNSVSQYELQNNTSKYQSKSSTNMFSRIIKNNQLPPAQLMKNTSNQLNIQSPTTTTVNNNNYLQQQQQQQPLPPVDSSTQQLLLQSTTNNNDNNKSTIPITNVHCINNNNTDIEPDDTNIKVLFTGLHSISCNYRIRHTYAPNHLFKDSMSNPRPSLDLSIKSDWKPCDLITGISSDQLMSLMIYEYQKNKHVTGIIDQPVIHPNEWLKPLKPFNWIKLDEMKDVDCNNENQDLSLSSEIENELKNKIKSFKTLNSSLHEQFKRLHHIAESCRKEESELNSNNATDQYYLQYSTWKSLFNSISNGVKDKTLDPEFDELPASWTIPVDGRPSKEECAERNPPEELCSICFQSSVTEWNPLVICDGCDISFHRNCYGIANIPEGSFYCDVCSEVFSKRARSKFMTNFATNPEAAIETAKSKKYPQCLLCGYSNGGAMKKTNKGEYIHIVCALWIPDVYINDKISMTNIEVSQNLLNFVNKNNEKYDPNIPAELSNNISNSYFIYYPDTTCHVSYISLKDRSQVVKSNYPSSTVVFAKCSICNIAKGLCYKCSCSNCNKYFHILCAWHNGNYFAVKCGEKDKIGSENIIYAGGGRGHQFEIYCINHSPNCTTPEEIKQRQDIQKKKREIIGKHPQQFYDTINKFYLSKAKSKSSSSLLQQQRSYEIDYYYTSSIKYSSYSSYNTPVRKFNLRQDSYIEEPKSLPTNLYKQKSNNVQITANLPPSPPFVPITGDVYPEKTCMCCLFRDNAELVECKKCHIVVHPECYGIPRQYRIKKRILKKDTEKNKENREDKNDNSTIEKTPVEVVEGENTFMEIEENHDADYEVRKQLFISPEKNNEGNESNQNQTPIHPTTVMDILNSVDNNPTPNTLIPSETTTTNINTENTENTLNTQEIQDLNTETKSHTKGRKRKEKDKEDDLYTEIEEIIPVDKDNWMCDVCRNDVEDAICVLCPRLGGAMRCVKDDIYMHVFCSHSNKHVKLIANEVDGGYYIDIRSLQKKWLGSILCPLCNMRYGRPINCYLEKNCPIRYHALCAYFHKKAVINLIDYNKAWILQLYCNDHIPTDVIFNKIQNRYIVVSKREEYLSLLEKYNVFTCGNNNVEECCKEMDKIQSDLENVKKRGENRINELMKRYKERMEYAYRIYNELKENNRIKINKISCIPDYILNHEEIPPDIHKKTRAWLLENGSDELKSIIKKQEAAERKRQQRREKNKQKKEKSQRKSTSSSSLSSSKTDSNDNESNNNPKDKKRRKSEPISLKPTRIQPSRLATTKPINNNNKISEEKSVRRSSRDRSDGRSSDRNRRDSRSRSRSERRRDRNRRKSNIIEDDDDQEEEEELDEEENDLLDDSILQESRRSSKSKKQKVKIEEEEEEDNDNDNEEEIEEEEIVKEEKESKKSKNEKNTNKNKNKRISLPKNKQKPIKEEKEEEEEEIIEKEKRSSTKRRNSNSLYDEMKEYQLMNYLDEDIDDEEDNNDDDDDEDFIMRIRKRKRRATTGSISETERDDVKRIKKENEKEKKKKVEQDEEDESVIDNTRNRQSIKNKSKSIKSKTPKEKEKNKIKSNKEENEEEDNNDEENSEDEDEKIITKTSKNKNNKPKSQSATNTPKEAKSSSSLSDIKCKSETKYNRNLRSKTPTKPKPENSRKFSPERERELEYMKNHETSKDKFSVKNLVKIPNFKDKTYTNDECGEIEKIFDDMSEDLKDSTLCEIVNEYSVKSIERMGNEIESNRSDNNINISTIPPIKTSTPRSNAKYSEKGVDKESNSNDNSSL